MAAEDDNLPDDDRIPEPTLADDETVTDPVETEDEADDPDAVEGTEDDDADEGDDLAAEPARPQSRGNRQMAVLREERRRLAEENARITRQLDEIRRAPPQPQFVETPQQRAERLALLSPEERTQAIIDESLARHSQQQQVLTNQLLEQSDQASFQAQQASNPLLKKLAPEVERRLADLRSRGQNVPRSIVATYLLGEKVLAQQGKGKPAARQRTRQQTARPANGRGDVPADRQNRRGTGDTAADMERRFGDVPI